MIAERVESWTQQWLRQGRQEGRQEGCGLSLKRLLARRFGPLSADILARIDHATPEQLDRWLDNVLDANSLEEVTRES